MVFKSLDAKKNTRSEESKNYNILDYYQTNQCLIHRKMILKNHHIDVFLYNNFFLKKMLDHKSSQELLELGNNQLLPAKIYKF